MRLLNDKKGGATSTLALMLVIMLSINIGLAFTQTGISSLNDEAEIFFNNSNTPYTNYLDGDMLTGDVADMNNYLPSDNDVSGDTGNIITDTYNSAKSWFKQKLEPLSFISNLFNQPKGFLLSIGIPNAVALAIQVLWNGIILLFLTAFIMGRN